MKLRLNGKAMPEDRVVLRCRCCKLNQFRTASGNCRKCHAPYEVPAPPVVRLLPRPPQRHGERYDLGFALRTLRKALGFSQRTLATGLGVPRTYISKVEQNHCTPVLRGIMRMEEALHVPPGLLLQVATASCRKVQ